MASDYSHSGGGSSPAPLLELYSDPVPPVAQSAWILRTTRTGTPLGLLLSLTYALDLYQLSYRTLEDTTIRTVLG